MTTTASARWREATTVQRYRGVLDMMDSLDRFRDRYAQEADWHNVKLMTRRIVLLDRLAHALYPTVDVYWKADLVREGLVGHHRPAKGLCMAHPDYNACKRWVERVQNG